MIKGMDGSLQIGLWQGIIPCPIVAQVHDDICTNIGIELVPDVGCLHLHQVSHEFQRVWFGVVDLDRGDR